MYPAIIKTLAYADIFNFPLTTSEIHQRLIGKKTSLSQVEAALKKFKLPQKNDHYFLKGRQKIVSSRIRASKRSEKKIKHAKRIAQLIKYIPSIEGIYLTGAVAVGNAAKNDDIDFMIITKSGKLWQTRLLTNTILDIIMMRRKPNAKTINNQACLNLWLDKSNLKTSPPHRLLYTAYEIIQAKPLVDKNNTYAQFLSQNNWIKKFLPNTKIHNIISQTKPSSLGIVEKASYKFQNRIMKQRRTTERVDLHSAFFHPRNTAKIVDQAFQQRVRKFL